MKFNRELLNDRSNVRFGLEIIDKLYLQAICIVRES